MLFRPLLDVRRSDLRAFLSARGAAWIDDPANSDPRFHRARARRSLADGVAGPDETPDRGPLDLVCDDASGTISGPLGSTWLGHAIACVSGRAVLPSRRAVLALRDRLTTGAGRATLSGALVDPREDGVLLTRERGRRPLDDLLLPAGRPQVWDGRFEFMAARPGWRVGAALGHMDQLDRADRVALNALPPLARGAHPVLFREGGARPVLADPSIEARCLVPERLRLASGGARREDDLETPPWRGPLHRPI